MFVACLGTAGMSACGSDTDPGASGTPCAEQTCSANQFCNYVYDWCGPQYWGYATGQAECASKALACEKGLPVCGCDGKVYPDACAAYASGTDIGGASEGHEYCAHSLTPPGRFACGPWYCDPTVSYCRYGSGDTGDRKVECRDLPAACGGTATCACVPPSGSGEGSCSDVEGNGVTGILLLEVWI